MTDEPSKIATVIKIARKTLRIAHENIVFALAVKFLVLFLGAIGYASMWAAVFADVGVSVIAILNAIRAMNVKKYNQRIKTKQFSIMPTTYKKTMFKQCAAFQYDY